MIDVPARNTRRRLLMGATAVAALVGTLTACSAAQSEPKEPTTAAPSVSVRSSLAMVSNDGHDLAFHVTPGHLPAIVLDAGGGLDSSTWADLAPEIASSTGAMVISYDRAGMGESDEVHGPWKAEDAASDLAAGLTALGADQVVLVAHSLAGEVATYYANEHPETVVGAVLLDASLPEFYSTAVTEMMVVANQEALTEAQAAPSTKETRQFIALAENYGPDHNAYNQMTWPDSIPAIAVLSESTPFPAGDAAELWRAAAAQFVNAADNRTLVTADKSSHNIVTDRPDVVLAQIETILAISH
ncbi:alpha/beta fold hydrolase [Specibacter sp. AOP5-B1-6]|uniref:alpha/beta fold hydrolase n=1 Tax=Specibacter sp. AOP5-B1-6 TaxID=3457653 RepID=UPI00402BD508